VKPNLADGYTVRVGCSWPDEEEEEERHEREGERGEEERH
jgi:hypothetical protein